MKIQRLVFAALCAPLVTFPVALAGSLLLGMLGILDLTSHSVFTPLQSVDAAVGALALAYRFMLLLGVPTVFVLYGRKALNRRALGLSGAVLGGLPPLPIAIAGLLRDWPDFLVGVMWLLVGIVSGFCMGRVIWGLAGEPDSEDEDLAVHRHQPAGAPRETIDSDLGGVPSGNAALTVLYDVRCALCCRARIWLAGQPKYVPMAFVAAGSNEAKRRFPGLDHDSTLEELTVVGWGGEVYRGAKAWVMCLWALKRYRSAALRMSEPEMLPVARRLIAWVSRNRFEIGEAAGWMK
ncbi:MAG TPA: DUF393 domain-containing protein [Thermoanaerobaculia bacterium]|jgi:predicted DCC family thiol-disulfide oxidoreductase YuxK